MCRLLSLALLAVLFLFAAIPAWAQVAPVVNAPLPEDLKAAISARAERPGEPEPWEYFPLEVGNAWEYEELFGSDDVTRMDVPKDTLIEGREYFILERTEYDGSTGQGYQFRFPVRFDTLRSAVVYWSSFSEEESMTVFIPCPFIGEVGEEIECIKGAPAVVTMVTDEGVLDFEPDTTVTGVHAREYGLVGGLFRYAAGFGEVYNDPENGYPYRITYCRVGGEEFGIEQYPVSSGGDPETTEVARAAVWPNPARGAVTVAFSLAESSRVSVETVDVLGRVVHRTGRVEQLRGHHELRLDLSDLPTGVYYIRVSEGEGSLATVPLTLVK